MCLYPKMIRNKKYTPNKKNNYNAPIPTDERLLYVPVKCGKCMECRKAKAREWQVRLCEELRNSQMHPIFITLTFTEEAITELTAKCGKNGANDIVTEAVKLFRERWRKKYKKSIKHWLVNELGHNGTERVHLHGILWVENQEQADSIESIWNYGYIFRGTYVNEKTINYIVKYINKLDIDHKGFEPIVLCSQGIGRGYQGRHNVYRENQTNEMYTLPNGLKVPLPIYYRNKIYTEDEREQLWLKKLDEQKRYINGIEIDISKSMDNYERVLTKAQETNVQLGYGDNSKEWKKRDYLATNGKLQEKTRELKKMTKNIQKRQESEYQSLMKKIQKK